MTSPVELVVSRLEAVRPNGNGYLARCPAHEDQKASLRVTPGDDGRALLKCFAGCSNEAVVEKIGLRMVDLFLPKGKPPKTIHREHTCQTIPKTIDLANDKKLSPEFLESLGLEDRPDGVLIPYRLMDGSSAVRQRLRTALSAKNGSTWLPGRGSPVPYGLDRLEKVCESSGYLILVEGESDCWTLWIAGSRLLESPEQT